MNKKLFTLILITLTMVSACAKEEATPTAVPEATTEVKEAVPTAELAGPTPTDKSTVIESTAEAPAVEFDNLHVSSPEWQDQIIYFLMTDRFNDGNPANNDQGAAEYDPADFSKYNGGDLQGIIDQLDYIQGLGATAVWITPPVSNQWWDPQVEFGGYHGYWAENFKKVDPHVGDLETYQALSDALHDRGMYLIQDIVANHTGNFFTYQSESGLSRYDPADPASGVRFNPDSVPVTKPSQTPFDQNDVTDPAQDEAAIYNWTPTIVDQADDEQRLTYQLSDLDDLNTENPVVRQALRDSYGYWIENVGVDGFRVDTAKYVTHDFWNDFIHSDDPETPGITAAAKATGRDDFISFGEVFNGSDPYNDSGDRFVASYLGSEAKPELSSVLNFPLFVTINRVFAEGQPSAYMVYRLNVAQDPAVFPDPYTTPVFIDNHDVPRFLSKGNINGLKQASMFVMTIPGIPIIYYGTEQGFDQTRAAMFAEGWASGGQDHFDRDAEMYRYIQTLTGFRKSNPLFTRGTLATLGGNDAGPGALAYRRDYEGQTAVIIFNTSDRAVLMTDMDSQLPEGTVLTLLYGLANQADLVVGREGKMTMELAPREGMILMVSDEVVKLEGGEAAVTIDSDLTSQVFSADIEIAGSVSEPGAAVKVIIDGNLSQAVETTAGDDGRFSAVVPISLFPPGVTDHSVTAYAPDLQVASAVGSFSTEVSSTKARATVFDRDGDDVGPLHTYSYPTDETFSRQMDIHSVTASAYGTNLVVDVAMKELTDVWDPTNGFDHVAYHIFIDLPGNDGLTVMPRLNSETPEGFAWDYMAFAEGWGTRLFSKEGADAGTQGTAVTPAPEVSVDKEAGIVSFLFAAESLGNPDTLEGAKVYITTWDWNGIDAVLRPLRPGGGQWIFDGGNESQGDPIIMDDTDVALVAADTRYVTVDPAGDDNGPYDPATATGRYSLPGDESFGAQMDLRRVTILPGEESLQVVLEMSEVTDQLEAPNGFDHVRFHVFIDVPGQEGLENLPTLNAGAPSGFAWDYTAIVDGWHNELYGTAGATDEAFGVPLSTVPELAINHDSSSISLSLPLSALSNPENLDQVKVYVTTWDWDQESQAQRALTPEGGPLAFGGGDGALDPLIIDDGLVGLPSPYLSPIPPTPQVEVTFLVTVPDNTPADADLYMTGPFNQWNPKDRAYQFSRNDDGTYSLVLGLDEGSLIEFRISRGTFANAEKLDAGDRFANHQETVPTGTATETVEITIEGWWDD